MSKEGCILTIELITTLPSKKSKELMVPFSNWFSTSPFGPQEQKGRIMGHCGELNYGLLNN